MRLAKTESLLLAAVLLLMMAALFAPALAQPPHAHDFADTRTLWGIPFCLDVLSNLPFALAGGWGLAALHRVSDGALSPAQRWCARLFFVGLVVTAFGSAAYHLAPHDAGLAVDRAAMAIAFAGLLGLLAADRVSGRAGHALAASLLVLGPLAVAGWLVTGNVLPWAMVQFGGMALILGLLCVRTDAGPGLPVRWSLVLLAYALAKLLEANDHALYEATGQLLSGHTLKHVVAAFAAWPVIAAVAGRAQGQNEARPAVPAV